MLGHILVITGGFGVILWLVGLALDIKHKVEQKLQPRMPEETLRAMYRDNNEFGATRNERQREKRK